MSHILAALVRIEPTSLNRALWSNDVTNVSDLAASDPTLKTLPTKRVNAVYDTLDFAERAHFTIGLANGVSSVQSGLDCLLVKLKIKLLNNSNNNNSQEEKSKQHETDEYKVTFVDDSCCLVELKQPVPVSAIFSAHY